MFGSKEPFSTCTGHILNRNRDKVNKFYFYEEVDYVIQMIRENPKEFKGADVVRPYW